MFVVISNALKLSFIVDTANKLAIFERSLSVNSKLEYKILLLFTLVASFIKTQYKYDFSYHRKRHILYDKEVIDTVIHMLKTSDLSFLDIGNIVGMTRNSVWFLNRKHEIRK